MPSGRDAPPKFLLWPDPRLVTSGAWILVVDAQVRAELSRIEAAMRAEGLDWLTGPQLGIMRRLACLRLGEDVLRLVNPHLVWESSGRAPQEESAPGFPGLRAQVRRPEVATLAWVDEAARPQERVLAGPRAGRAAALVDQCAGIPLFERLSPAQQRAAQEEMSRARAAARRAEEAARAAAAREAEEAARARSETAAPSPADADGDAVDEAMPEGAAPRSAAPVSGAGTQSDEQWKDAPRMRLIFMGTPDFSVTALDALVDAGHEIAAVYTQPPRPAGRGKKLRPTPVHARAEALGFEVRHPLSLKPEAEQEALRALNADIAVVVAYGLLLPQGALDAPRLGCINIHASLLPRWRGAAPIQRAIMAGDAETGVGIMRMEAGLDTGPVILERRIPIGPQDTAASLHDRLAAVGAAAAVDALSEIAAGVAVETVQPEEGVTYAAKIDKAEAKIDWTRPAAEVDRLIRGLSPFPGAWFELEGERIKALLSVVEEAPEGAAAAPGETLDDALLVACGDGGAVRLLRIQRAGKGAMEVEDALRGRAIPEGTALG